MSSPYDDWSLVTFRAPKHIMDDAAEIVAVDDRFKDVSHYLRSAIAVFNRENKKPSPESGR